MVELLSSTLGGGPFGPGVGPLTSSAPKGPADISHFFVAIDPARFGLDRPFARGVDELWRALHDLPPVDPERPVLVPGEPEAKELAERMRSGVPVHGSVLASLDELAHRVGVSAVDRRADRAVDGG
jgi:LDH2 family malate/lactate/ureidoglycolate dehydrogenase